MRKKPSKPGITRLSETETCRSLSKEAEFSESSQKMGKFCVACNKWAPYLEQKESFCINCNCRSSSLHSELDKIWS